MFMINTFDEPAEIKSCFCLDYSACYIYVAFSICCYYELYIIESLYLFQCCLNCWMLRMLLFLRNDQHFCFCVFILTIFFPTFYGGYVCQLLQNISIFSNNLCIISIIISCQLFLHWDIDPQPTYVKHSSWLLPLTACFMFSPYNVYD